MRTDQRCKQTVTLKAEHRSQPIPARGQVTTTPLRCRTFSIKSCNSKEKYRLCKYLPQTTPQKTTRRPVPPLPRVRNNRPRYDVEGREGVRRIQMPTPPIQLPRRPMRKTRWQRYSNTLDHLRRTTQAETGGMRTSNIAAAIHQDSLRQRRGPAQTHDSAPQQQDGRQRQGNVQGQAAHTRGGSGRGRGQGQGRE